MIFSQDRLVSVCHAGQLIADIMIFNIEKVDAVLAASIEGLQAGTVARPTNMSYISQRL